MDSYTSICIFWAITHEDVGIGENMAYLFQCELVELEKHIGSICYHRMPIKLQERFDNTAVMKTTIDGKKKMLDCKKQSAHKMCSLNENLKMGKGEL